MLGDSFGFAKALHGRRGAVSDLPGGHRMRNQQRPPGGISQLKPFCQQDLEKTRADWFRDDPSP